MYFIEYIRVGQERAEARLRAQVDRPAAVLRAGEIGRVRIAKDPSAESDEAGVFVLS